MGFAVRMLVLKHAGVTGSCHSLFKQFCPFSQKIKQKCKNVWFHDQNFLQNQVSSKNTHFQQMVWWGCTESSWRWRCHQLTQKGPAENVSHKLRMHLKPNMERGAAPALLGKGWSRDHGLAHLFSDLQVRNYHTKGSGEWMRIQTPMPAWFQSLVPSEHPPDWAVTATRQEGRCVGRRIWF